MFKINVKIDKLALLILFLATIFISNVNVVTSEPDYEQTSGLYM